MWRREGGRKGREQGSKEAAEGKEGGREGRWGEERKGKERRVTLFFTYKRKSLCMLQIYVTFTEPFVILTCPEVCRKNVFRILILTK